jgi:hypothetical protein
VDVVGALTTFVNPAALAVDTGTSTLIDGLEAAYVPAAAGGTTASIRGATTVAPVLATTTSFRASFFTIALFQ